LMQSQVCKIFESFCTSWFLTAVRVLSYVRPEMLDEIVLLCKSSFAIAAGVRLLSCLSKNMLFKSNSLQTLQISPVCISI